MPCAPNDLEVQRVIHIFCKILGIGIADAVSFGGAGAMAEFGVSNGNRGVQWNLAFYPQQDCVIRLGVNLEGSEKMGGRWLIAPFILSRPSIEELGWGQMKVPRPENVRVRFVRDYWQGANRPPIIEKYLGGRLKVRPDKGQPPVCVTVTAVDNEVLSEPGLQVGQRLCVDNWTESRSLWPTLSMLLDKPSRWDKILKEAYECLNREALFKKRIKHPVTSAYMSPNVKVPFGGEFTCTGKNQGISPHLTIQTVVGKVEDADIEGNMRQKFKELLPVYRWVCKSCCGDPYALNFPDYVPPDNQNAVREWVGVVCETHHPNEPNL